MNENGTGIVPVMPMGNGGDWGNSSFFWVFALLLLGMNGGGFGWGNGNGNSNAIQNDINRGFDNQNLQAQTRDILSAVNSGTAQSVAATNQTFHDNLSAMQSFYNETARDLASLAVGQANQLAKQNECCCETKQLIQQINYDGAMRDAATNANITAQIQGVKDMINANTIQGLRDQVDSLRDQVNMSGVLRFPNSWSYGAGPFPPIFGCGCNA
ncbi:MAG: hypothetical protein IKN54_06140 [Lachnospiraceae bacterium]|nr:hypothetical protein [Lachnospiraceae bacterium]